MTSLSERWAALQERIARACARAGRDPSAIRVVAVTKGVPIERIAEAYALGLRDFGENYWQEARSKLDALPHDIRWHFIGHLQTNKVKYVVGRFALIQSVDRVSLLEEVQRVASKRGLRQPVLIEVRLAEVAERAGVSFVDAPALIERTLAMPNLILQGLMGIAPFTDDVPTIRTAFRKLRQLYEQLPAQNRQWLSMGMSHDFEIAIEEGSTMLRLGTALFGERA
ncbi:MAG: YggS family pyridoxal phosphate-dependent enzyme [Fimbriimonadales bacterium]|nr:YggS family pyridoxal phosphate-dependent enzyme [Fimbriimonadales bacterium]MDW8052535.1 YggS family pyridoxal phosphate-dependent enzyme [Armatimonadota bacterium]